VGLNTGARQECFDITAASETMAILALAKDAQDLKERLGNIIIGINNENNFVLAKDIKAHEAMAILLKDAIKPNLVQTLENNPAFVHAGPFANIAHGCSSIIATKTAASVSDFVVTEAGFGADLGAEKFLDIKCRIANIAPSAAVIVATVQGLKNLGGALKQNLKKVDMAALKKGLPNLMKHIENIKNVFGLPAIVAINKFAGDTDEEIDFIIEACSGVGVKAVLCNAWALGSRGAVELAQETVKLSNGTPHLKFAYDIEDSADDKIKKIAQKIYGAKDVIFMPKAKKVLERIKNTAYAKMPVCIAKTQYSLSDNPALLAGTKDFNITIKDMLIRGGAGFIVAIAGDIMLMPGLCRQPAAENMTINSDGQIKGLF
jgi:formate--tetrahydrofolate ligase